MRSGEVMPVHGIMGCGLLVKSFGLPGLPCAKAVEIPITAAASASPPTTTPSATLRIVVTPVAPVTSWRETGPNRWEPSQQRRVVAHDRLIANRTCRD